MDKMIGKLIGTIKAGENAEIIDRDGQRWVMWANSGEVVKFDNRASFESWIANNDFVASIELA